MTAIKRGNGGARRQQLESGGKPLQAPGTLRNNQPKARPASRIVGKCAAGSFVCSTPRRMPGLSPVPGSLHRTTACGVQSTPARNECALREAHHDDPEHAQFHAIFYVPFHAGGNVRHVRYTGHGKGH
ncbi:hypothetical protein [Paraburkholderia antibiotica]|uniref:Uncharacterized protein n=1 Tax=Paraburkholderia antibiotica TaxID=2728839 RepID=A0A7X9X945_9BURK|nr:hypothetical protein [Paraburkholderia antibiotica]NML33781.1 hypothetical protein [Paraburkholderia antibiotica]